MDSKLLKRLSLHFSSDLNIESAHFFEDDTDYSVVLNYPPNGCFFEGNTCGIAWNMPPTYKKEIDSKALTLTVLGKKTMMVGTYPKWKCTKNIRPFFDEDGQSWDMFILFVNRIYPHPTLGQIKEGCVVRVISTPSIAYETEFHKQLSKFLSNQIFVIPPGSPVMPCKYSNVLTPSWGVVLGSVLIPLSALTYIGNLEPLRAYNEKK